MITGHDYEIIDEIDCKLSMAEFTSNMTNYIRCETNARLKEQLTGNSAISDISRQLANDLWSTRQDM